MNQMQEEMWDALCELSGEEVLRLLTHWKGLQILDEEFREYLGEEGIMPEVEEEPDDDLEDDFDSFCCKYNSCRGCRFLRVFGDCETLWSEAKEEE